MASLASLISQLLESVAEMVTLLAVAWVVIFGGVGAVLAYTRGRQPAWGLLLGCLAGPVGWWILCTQDQEDEEGEEVDFAMSWNEL